MSSSVISDNQYPHEQSSIEYYMREEAGKGGDYAARAKVYRKRLRATPKQEWETRALACERLAGNGGVAPEKKE